MVIFNTGNPKSDRSNDSRGILGWIIRRKFKFVATLAVIFLLLNAVAFIHAYHFTHFDISSTVQRRTKDQLTLYEKFKVILSGVDNPRPLNKTIPTLPFENIVIQSSVKTSCWLIQAEQGLGTVILFHGYAGTKSSMLDKALVFRELGYHTLLVDLMGSGESEGNTTTIGYHESKQVTDCFNYIKRSGEDNIVLFGTSMGAVAIMKAVHEDTITPQALVLECPFGSLLQTVEARFRMQGIPAFPMANLLVFWGGVQNNFSGFSHRPAVYAKSITMPVLFFYGMKDKKVSAAETYEIFTGLRGSKTLHCFINAGHENYLSRYRYDWQMRIQQFLGVHAKTQ